MTPPIHFSLSISIRCSFSVGEYRLNALEASTASFSLGYSHFPQTLFLRPPSHHRRGPQVGRLAQEGRFDYLIIESTVPPPPSVTCSLRRVRVGPRTRRRRRFNCAGGSSCPTKVGHDPAAHPKPASSQTRARLLDSSKARTRPLDETDSRPPASDPWRRLCQPVAPWPRRDAPD
jgi:hypothetical protein